METELRYTSSLSSGDFGPAGLTHRPCETSADALVSPFGRIATDPYCEWLCVRAGIILWQVAHPRATTGLVRRIVPDTFLPSLCVTLGSFVSMGTAGQSIQTVLR